ncbi:MAG: 50S ribosomal protein L1 [Methanosarcinales archaeon]|nr:50S ribosomal protein L1 [ANME-2 cluster archaeon]MDF1531146.1 50S ribosomal protein L1 [ANME-2 cluster archaeon]MDW7777195.1 50S ribosomal protein L1 [Methanosarcinales archaeon]
MTLNDTIQAVKQALEAAPERKFTESVDIAFNLKNIDMSQPANRVDEEIILPNGLGKSIKIAVFAKGDIAQRATKAGADMILDPEEIESLKDNKNKARELANDIDFFVSDMAYMPIIAKSLGPVLGPRGKMPEPLTPDKNIEDVIKKAKNSIRVRSKDRLTFHLPVGRKDMDPEKLAQNVQSVIDRIEHKLEKGKHNIRSVYVKTTMGPAVKVM